jgi:nicotinamidase-related amidase
MRHDRILARDQTLLLVVDFQEKLLKAFKEPEKFLPNCAKIIKFAKIMKLPILWTEQYPKGLGVTVDEIKIELADLNPIEKQSFSCFGEPGFVDALARNTFDQVMICGIETHICVAQTVLDGIACGYQMHVITDACGSRKKQDHKIGLRKVERAGAVLATSEMAMYEILARSDAQEFREVLQIVK